MAIEKTKILVADVGGTKSDLAIFAAGDYRQPLFQKRYENDDFTEVKDVIEDFLSECQYQPELACLALAGVVRGTICTMTNLPWELDSEKLEKIFGLRKVILINDLTAVSSSVDCLQGEDLFTLQQGGNGGDICGIVAPGTGLGEGLLVRFGDKSLACGSEGGHVDFAPIDREQLQLLTWMQQKEMPVCYETLVAGPGLQNLYNFCTDSLGIAESTTVKEKLPGALDKTPIIIEGALQAEPCAACVKSVELFLSILGSEAGNLALKLYAKGGIYLGGGILPRLVHRVSFDGFLQSFRAKGKMSQLMEEFPIHLIMRTDAALLGGANYASHALKEYLSGG